jgi:hypothetical protein
MLELALDKP